jgi:hypothetical protein
MNRKEYEDHIFGTVLKELPTYGRSDDFVGDHAIILELLTELNDRISALENRTCQCNHTTIEE